MKKISSSQIDEMIEEYYLTPSGERPLLGRFFLDRFFSEIYTPEERRDSWDLALYAEQNDTVALSMIYSRYVGIQEDFDHDFTDEVVCPHCGYEYEDSWEFHSDPEIYETETTCLQCGKRFKITIETSVQYSTKPMEEGSLI